MSDPTKQCRVYLEKGCSHVDGVLCDFPKCSILTSYEASFAPVDQTVNKIISAIDSLTLLGAAHDCMSDASKLKFKNTLRSILETHR